METSLEFFLKKKKCLYYTLSETATWEGNRLWMADENQ